MASIKIEIIEGMDRFGFEGEEEVGRNLLGEWRARIDALHREAKEQMDEMMRASGQLPPRQQQGPRPVPPGSQVRPFAVPQAVAAPMSEGADV